MGSGSSLISTVGPSVLVMAEPRGQRLGSEAEFHCLPNKVGHGDYPRRAWHLSGFQSGMIPALSVASRSILGSRIMPSLSFVVFQFFGGYRDSFGHV